MSDNGSGSAHEWTEHLKVEGQHLAQRVEELLHEGNVRHLVISHDNHTIAEFPVNLGVASLVLAPTLAAVAAIGAVLTHCTITVVRTAV